MKKLTLVLALLVVATVAAAQNRPAADNESLQNRVAGLETRLIQAEDRIQPQGSELALLRDRVTRLETRRDLERR
ncbi:MAG: hypothetical protein EXQ85_00445 [Alphaproteobacteria bacterium]|nr:hypothetical protein [Alphaproteobacteria bacterium]